jgi:hypothetical protein
MGREKTHEGSQAKTGGEEAGREKKMSENRLYFD